MSFPPAHQIRRIVFLVASFAMAGTVGYIAMPRGDVPLRTSAARSRTQDITIRRDAPRTLRPVPSAPSSLNGASFAAGGVAPERGDTGQPVQQGLLASSSADGGGFDAPATRRDGRVSVFSGGGFGHSPHPSRGGTGSQGFSGGGMHGGGVWGGATGVARAAEPQASDTAAETARSLTALPAPKKPAAPAPTTTRTSAPSTGGSSGGSTSTGSSSGGEASITTATTSTTTATTTTLAPGGSTGGTLAGGTFTGGTSGDTGDPPPIGTLGSGSSPSPTPEPITLLLVGSGLAGAYGARRLFKEKS
jgi:hypothetical protein